MEGRRLRRRPIETQILGEPILPAPTTTSPSSPSTLNPPPDIKSDELTPIPALSGQNPFTAAPPEPPNNPAGKLSESSMDSDRDLSATPKPTPSSSTSEFTESNHHRLFLKRTELQLETHLHLGRTIQLNPQTTTFHLPLLRRVTR